MTTEASRALHVCFALASTLALAAACSAFSDGEDSPPSAATPDAGDPTDQTAPTEAGAPTDAMSDAPSDGTPACTTTLPLLADGFDNGGFGTNWNHGQTQCVGEITFLAEDAGDLAVSSACEATDVNAFNVLTAKNVFPLARRTDIAFSVRFDKADPHVFAQLVQFVSDVKNIVFVRTGDGVELRIGAVGPILASWTFASSGFHEIRLGIDAPTAGGTSIAFDAMLDGVSRSFEVTNEHTGAIPLVPQIGVFFPVATGIAQDTYDDVRIWSCP